MAQSISNTEVWDRLMRKIEAAHTESHVRVGVLAGAGNAAAGFSMIELAAVHEYGSPAAGIPERSFIRSTFRDRHDDLVKMCGQLVARFIDGKMELDQALGLLGLWAVAQIKTQIRKGIAPPNAPSTIARKKSSKPLIDTGRLINAITSNVELK